MDPRTGLYAAGAVEHAVLCAAGTEMARYYGLPAESSGLCTQTYEPDLQTAWEKANGALLVTLVRPRRAGRSRPAGRSHDPLPRADRHGRRDDPSRPAGAHRHPGATTICGSTRSSTRSGPCGSFLGERSTRQNARGGEWRLSDLGVQGSWDAWRAAGSPTHGRRRSRAGRAAARRRRSRCRSATTRPPRSPSCSAAPTRRPSESRGCTGDRSARGRTTAGPARRPLRRQIAERVEDESREQLGVEVRRLLRHRLAAVGDRAHLARPAWR